MTDTSGNPRDIPEQLAAAENDRMLEQVAKATGEKLDFVRDQVGKLLAMHVGLPGVNSAPLITGPNHYFETCCHLFECGARVTADPIKTYQVPTDVSGMNGRWVYDNEDSAPEAYAERARRQVRAEREAYRQALKERREGKVRRVGDAAQPRNRQQRRRR